MGYTCAGFLSVAKGFNPSDMLMKCPKKLWCWAPKEPLLYCTIIFPYFSVHLPSALVSSSLETTVHLGIILTDLMYLDRVPKYKTIASQH